MASRIDLANIASRLSRLVESSPQKCEGLEAWYAAAREADAQIRAKYPDVNLPPLVMHFMHDADIRIKDSAFRDAQLSAIREVIWNLERGTVPQAHGANVRLSVRGAIIGIGLIVIAVVVGMRSCA
jgi:hypothetical protein